MNLKDLCEVFNYKITDGSEYQWNCFGSNARFLDFENDYATASVIFDSKTQVVYQGEVWPKNKGERPYRYVNPDYSDSLKNEAEEKEIDNSIAFDNTKFIDLEVHEDFLEKGLAIWNNLPFDKRIQIPIEEDLFYDLAKQAHYRDITINSLVEEILLNVIKEHNRENNT